MFVGSTLVVVFEILVRHVSVSGSASSSGSLNDDESSGVWIVDKSTCVITIVAGG